MESFAEVDSKLKLSKIPTDFVHFDNIRGLPARQLAYTAHLAHRLGMENEDLWIRIRDAFLDSHDRMRPKLFTQCLVAIAKRPNLLSDRTACRFASLVANRANEFRFVDLVMIVNAFASLGVPAKYLKQTCPVLTEHLSRGLKHVDERTISALVTAVGKLGLDDPNLIEELVHVSQKHSTWFDEFEVSAFIRTCSVFNPVPKDTINVIETLILKNPRVPKMDIGCLNIALHALAKMSVSHRFSQEALDVLFSGISRSESLIAGNDHSVVPHLLFSCSQLARSNNHIQVSLKLANLVLRNLRLFKPISLPLALEGMKKLQTRFPEDEDVRVVVAVFEDAIPSIVEQFLVMSTEEEKARLLDSKYCQRSQWFTELVKSSMEPSGSTSTLDSDNTQAFSSTNDPDFTEAEYSIFFRRSLKEALDEEGLEENSRILHKFITNMNKMGIKTVCRALQMCVRYSMHEDSPRLISEILCRFSEIYTDDLLGVLQLLRRAHVKDLGDHKDAIEAKIAVELDMVKSLTTRNDIIAAAKLLGIDDPEDLIDVWEKTLASDRLAKLGKSQNSS